MAFLYAKSRLDRPIGSDTDKSGTSVEERRKFVLNFDSPVIHRGPCPVELPKIRAADHSDMFPILLGSKNNVVISIETGKEIADKSV